MGFFSWFTTTEKAVDTGLDLIKKGASGIDMLFFTDEEKSLASAKIMEQVIAMNKATADENTVRSKTRRALAKVIIYNYMALINLSAVCKLSGDVENAKFLFDLANKALGSAVLAVVIFYFGYYGINAVVKSAKGN